MNSLKAIFSAIPAADQAAAQEVSGTQTLLYYLVMIGLMIAVFYFLLIRPQKKQRKEEEKLRNSLEIGDEIVTIGGIYGRIVSLKEDTIVIESSGDRSKLEMSRTSVSQNLTAHEDAPKEQKPKKVKKAKTEEKLESAEEKK